MSNDNHAQSSSASTTPSRARPPRTAGDTDWSEHKARRKAAKRAEKSILSRPIAMAVAVVAVGASIGLASVFVGLVENGNQLPQALQLAHVNAQSDVVRSEVVLDTVDDDTATLVFSRSVETAVIIVEGLPKPDEGTYRVWYETTDGYAAVGELSVTYDGSEVWATLTGDVSSAQSVLVTADSADATAPGSDIVAEIEL